MNRRTLSVTVDSVALPDEEARAIWDRFSVHMEANRGDLAGFAAAEGFASVEPLVTESGARLAFSRTKPQGVYRNAGKTR